MFIVGGAGAYMDLGGNRSIRPLIELIAALRRPVVAICYGVAVLIQATHPLTKMPLVWGRLITGHSEEDDYTDGTTDVPVEGCYGPNYGSAPMTLEQMIKQYTGPDGGFLSRNGSPYMAVVDGPFITARTTPDGYPAALLAVAQLHGAGQMVRVTNLPVPKFAVPEAECRCDDGQTFHCDEARTYPHRPPTPKSMLVLNGYSFVDLPTMRFVPENRRLAGDAAQAATTGEVKEVVEHENRPIKIENASRSGGSLVFDKRGVPCSIADCTGIRKGGRSDAAIDRAQR